jgi:alpha/beta superfamily hydrolase
MGVTLNRTEVAFQSGDLKLEGLLHLPDAPSPSPRPGIVIAHPHPQYGGDMYNSVVQALCEAALSSGVAALRFNFRGVGFSDGAYDNGAGEIDDVAAAIDYLRGLPEIDTERVGLAGYSFGAMVALRAASDRADLGAVVSVANPTVRGPKVEIHMPRPTLFITGDRDPYCDGALLEEYRTQIGPDVTVEIVPGVDHFWVGSEARLKESVGNFLGRHLAEGPAQ